MPAAAAPQPSGVLTLVRRVVLAVGSVLVLGVVGILVAATAPSYILGRETYTVTSGSMEPAIPTGAVVVTSPIRASEILPDDVISFQTDAQPGITVTHRVVVPQPEGQAITFRTKGDANGTEDAVPFRVDMNQSINRVDYFVPYAGYMTRFLDQSGFRYVLVALGVWLLWARWKSGQEQVAQPGGATA
jgi:signal peptidase